jgi:hypothetical protein
MLLEDPKDLLDDIASRRMMQIEQLLGVAWTWKNISEKFDKKDKPLTHPWHDPIQTNGTARFNKG